MNTLCQIKALFQVPHGAALDKFDNPTLFPHGGVRPIHQKSTCLTQSILGPYLVHSWSRNTPESSPNSTRVLHRVVPLSLKPKLLFQIPHGAALDKFDEPDDIQVYLTQRINKMVLETQLPHNIVKSLF